MSARASRFVSVFLFASSTIASADVIVVSQSGGDYSQIQDAVDNAADGDTILVKTGLYVTFHLFDKDLRIIADAQAAVTTYPVFGFGNGIELPSSNKTVIVRGIEGPYWIGNSQGIVRFEDTVLRGGGGFCSPTGGGIGGPGYICTEHRPGAEVLNSSRVEFVRCTIVGATGGPNPVFGIACVPSGVGLEATNSQIVLYDSTYSGGPIVPPTAGCQAGAALVGDPAQIKAFVGPEDFSVTSPLRTGDLGSLSIAGNPGDLLLMFLASKAGQFAVPPHHGLLLVSPPIFGVCSLGNVPTTGTLTLPISIGDLPPPGVDAVDLQLQPVLVGPSGIATFAPPALLTVLSSAF